MNKTKKLIKGLLWIVWVPLIFVGLLILFIGLTFLFNLNSKTLKADSYVISQKAYDENGPMFDISVDDYTIICDLDDLIIANKFNVYVENIYGNGNNFSINNILKSHWIKFVIDDSIDASYIYSSDNNNNITIKADNKDHLLRGAYAFLEEFGGVECYTSTLIKYSKDKISYPLVEDGYVQSYSDYFEMIDTDWISPTDNEYSWFRGYNASTYRFKKDSTVSGTGLLVDPTYPLVKNSVGGCVEYITGFAHTLTGDFVNKNKYFESHPEYFAMDKSGNRISSNICYTNPDTINVIKQEVRELLESSKYDSNAPLQIISLTQPDDLTSCCCEECVKRAKQYGGYSGINLELVNAVAQYVKDLSGEDHKYDNVAIDTFAYRYTRKAPKGIKPLDNVIIRLCSIECCSSHYIDDNCCATNKSFMNDLQDWKELTDRIYIWDYCTNFAHFTSYFPDFQQLAHNIRVFYENNVVGIYEEGDYCAANCDTEFYELRSYLISKVMQNPYCDYNEVIKDFCEAYYGAASEKIIEFINYTNKISSKVHLNIYKKPDLTLPLSNKEIFYLDGLWQAAKELVKEDSTALSNVTHSEYCWRYYKMYKKTMEFSDPIYYPLESAKLIEEIKATGNISLHEVYSSVSTNNLLQSAIVDLYPIFELVVKFIYGPF